MPQAVVSAELLVTLHKYPDPPKLFILTPDVETLWHRYEGYLQGKEPLSSMAYFQAAHSRTEKEYRFVVVM